jgi:hypothetical protein
VNGYWPVRVTINVTLASTKVNYTGDQVLSKTNLSSNGSDIQRRRVLHAKQVNELKTSIPTTSQHLSALIDRLSAVGARAAVHMDELNRVANLIKSAARLPEDGVSHTSRALKQADSVLIDSPTSAACGVAADQQLNVADSTRRQPLPALPAIGVPAGLGALLGVTAQELAPRQCITRLPTSEDAVRAYSVGLVASISAKVWGWSCRLLLACRTTL